MTLPTSTTNMTGLRPRRAGRACGTSCAIAGQIERRASRPRCAVGRCARAACPTVLVGLWCVGRQSSISQKSLPAYMRRCSTIGPERQGREEGERRRR